MTEETGQAQFSNPVRAGMDADLEDEALATAARARYRTDGIVGITADHLVSAQLVRDEQLLAVRHSVSVERLSDGAQAPVLGPLAITTERLLMLDPEPVTLASLDELDDVTLVTDRLLVMLTSGAGFTISAPQPKLLRVELAAARASRTDRQTAASSSPAPRPPTDLPRL